MIVLTLGRRVCEEPGCVWNTRPGRFCSISVWNRKAWENVFGSVGRATRAMVDVGEEGLDKLRMAWCWWLRCLRSL
jgi:hypothetical protein